MAPSPMFPTQLVESVLPPWTSTVAASGTVLEQVALPAGQMLLLPISDALPVSVDALFVGPDDVPMGRSDLGRMLQCLRPGGAGVLAMPRGRFARKELEMLLAASGLRYSSAVASPNRSVGHLVIVENPGGLAERPPLRLSVVLTGDFAELPPLCERVSAWMQFLHLQFRVDGTEIIAVRDCPADPLVDFQDGEPAYREIQHYREFGGAVSALTGMRFARGRWVLIDASQGGTPPSSFLDLLLPMLRPIGSRPRVVASLATGQRDSSFPTIPPIQGGAQWKRSFGRLRASVRRRLLGAGNPVTDFALFDFSAARALHSPSSRRSRTGASYLRLPKLARSDVREVPIRRSRPGPRQSGLVKSLWLWVRRA